MTAGAPPTHEVTSWGQVCDGDRVLLPGPAGRPVPHDVARRGMLAAARPATSSAPWSTPTTPPADMPAARSYRGPVTVAVEVLRAGGLDIEIIEH